MNTILQMKKMPSIAMVLCVATVAYATHLADHVFGVVAFTYGYLTFCLLTGLAFGVVWRACLGNSDTTFAFVVFAVLAANIILPPPSSRILRSVMLEVPQGTEATAIVDIANQKYRNSPYALPWIHEDRAGGFDRVHVSLLPQEARSCTSAIFIVENGRVLRSIFSPD